MAKWNESQHKTYPYGSMTTIAISTARIILFVFLCVVIRMLSGCLFIIRNATMHSSHTIGYCYCCYCFRHFSLVDCRYFLLLCCYSVFFLALHRYMYGVWLLLFIINIVGRWKTSHPRKYSKTIAIRMVSLFISGLGMWCVTGYSFFAQAQTPALRTYEIFTCYRKRYI